MRWQHTRFQEHFFHFNLNNVFKLSKMEEFFLADQESPKVTVSKTLLDPRDAATDTRLVLFRLVGMYRDDVVHTIIEQRS